MKIIPKIGMYETNFTLVPQNMDPQGRDLDRQAADIDQDTNFDASKDVVTVDPKAVTEEGRDTPTIIISERQARLLANLKEGDGDDLDNTLRNIGKTIRSATPFAKLGDNRYLSDEYLDMLEKWRKHKTSDKDLRYVFADLSEEDIQNIKKYQPKLYKELRNKRILENRAADVTKKSDFNYKSTPKSRQQVKKMDRTDYIEKLSNIRKKNKGIAKKATAAGTTFDYHIPKKKTKGTLNTTTIDKKEYRNSFYATPTKDSYIH